MKQIIYDHSTCMYHLGHVEVHSIVNDLHMSLRFTDCQHHACVTEDDNHQGKYVNEHEAAYHI